METGETPAAPRQGDQPISGEDVRRATFPQALRGYDRQAVHDLLDRVADWMEGAAGSVSSATPGMREELAKVGERTAGILTAAEEAARNIREEATQYAERLRADADDEARKSRLNASQKMDEMVAEAEEKAQRIIDEAVARRRQLNQAISSLVNRREEIAVDATRLAEELLGAVGELRGREADAEPESNEELGEPESEVDSDEEELEEPGTELAADEEEEVPEPEEETELFELPSEETPLPEAEADSDLPRGPSQLLVDPDETPPGGYPARRRE